MYLLLLDPSEGIPQKYLPNVSAYQGFQTISPGTSRSWSPAMSTLSWPWGLTMKFAMRSCHSLGWCEGITQIHHLAYQGPRNETKSNESENQFINGCPIKWLNGGLFHHPLLGKSTLPVTVVKLHLEASNGVTGLENFIDAALLGQRLCFSQLLGRKAKQGLETNTEGTREDSWNLVLVSKKMIVHVHISWRKSRRCWGLQLDPSKHVGFNFGQLVDPGPHGLDRFDLQLLLQQFCISNAPHVFRRQCHQSGGTFNVPLR